MARCVALILAICLAAGCGTSREADGSSAEEAMALQSTFDTLHSLDVMTWTDLDWCTAFHYEQGAFVNSESSQCTVFGVPSRAFDQAALTAFAQVRTNLLAVGLYPTDVAITYNPDGSIERARFGFWSGGAYVYDRGGDWTDFETYTPTMEVTETWVWFQE